MHRPVYLVVYLYNSSLRVYYFDFLHLVGPDTIQQQMREHVSSLKPIIPVEIGHGKVTNGPFDTIYRYLNQVITCDLLRRMCSACMPVSLNTDLLVQLVMSQHLLRYSPCNLPRSYQDIPTT